MVEITKQKQANLNITKLFRAGQFANILKIHKEFPESIASSEESYIIGALSFLGKTFEAEEIFKSRKSGFPKEDLAACLLYLGIGFTRKSQYKRARYYFKQNQKLHALDVDPEIAFYAYQGIAFYLYFVGQFYRCEKYATKALRLAIRAKNSYLKVLAQDLLAHTQVQNGRVYSGLDLLRETSELAKDLGNQAFFAATAVSILLYEAQYGHRAPTILQDLKNKLASLEVQDSYSKSNIILELAKQLTMRGQWQQAETLLNEQAPTIFASENRRQEITLNLRFADIAFLRGQFSYARQYLRGAQVLLHAEADKNFAVQILELETRLLEEEQSPLLALKTQELVTLSKNFSNKINLNMLARRGLIEEKSYSDDDAIHKLLRELSQSQDKATEIILSSGYLSWFYKVLPLKKGETGIVMGLPTNQTLLISEKGLQLVKLAEFSQKIIECLQLKTHSKAELVQRLWGYEYHPLRHDNLVHTAMSTLRKTLGDSQAWIMTLDNGYSLNPGVRIVSLRTPVKKIESSQATTDVVKPLLQDSSLNARQIQALEFLQKNRFLNTRDYKELFKTSEITASRDLSALKDLKYVVRIGHGRATQYTLKGDLK